MRRCFARVLLITNLVGKESPRCLTLSADRAKPFLVEQAAEPMGYLNYSESALLICNRLSDENVKKYGNTQNEHIFCSLNWDFFLHY